VRCKKVEQARCVRDGSLRHLRAECNDHIARLFHLLQLPVSIPFDRPDTRVGACHLPVACLSLRLGGLSIPCSYDGAAADGRVSATWSRHPHHGCLPNRPILEHRRVSPPSPEHYHCPHAAGHPRSTGTANWRHDHQTSGDQRDPSPTIGRYRCGRRC
jgi:hypothetical protein